MSYQGYDILHGKHITVDSQDTRVYKVKRINAKVAHASIVIPNFGGHNTRRQITLIEAAERTALPKKRLNLPDVVRIERDLQIRWNNTVDRYFPTTTWPEAIEREEEIIWRNNPKHPYYGPVIKNASILHNLGFISNPHRRAYTQISNHTKFALSKKEQRTFDIVRREEDSLETEARQESRINSRRNSAETSGHVTPRSRRTSPLAKHIRHSSDRGACNDDNVTTALLEKASQKLARKQFTRPENPDAHRSPKQVVTPTSPVVTQPASPANTRQALPVRLPQFLPPAPAATPALPPAPAAPPAHPAPPNPAAHPAPFAMADAAERAEIARLAGIAAQGVDNIRTNLRDIPKFNPDKKDNVVSYITKFKGYCTINAIADDDVRKWNLFQQSLDGEAITWFTDTMATEDHGTAAQWEAIFTALMREFNAVAGSATELERTWHTLNAGAFKSFWEYVQKVKQVGTFLGRDPADIFKMIILQAPADIWNVVQAVAEPDAAHPAANQLKLLLKKLKEWNARTNPVAKTEDKEDKSVGFMAMKVDKRLDTLTDALTQLTMVVTAQAKKDTKPDEKEPSKPNDTRRDRSKSRDNWRSKSNDRDRGRDRDRRANSYNRGDRRDRSQSGRRAPDWMKCYLCEEKGHLYNDCPLKKKNDELSRTFGRNSGGGGRFRGRSREKSGASPQTFGLLKDQIQSMVGDQLLSMFSGEESLKE